MPHLSRIRSTVAALAFLATALPVFAWDLGPSLPGPRKDAAIVANGNHVLVFGGRTTGNVLLASCHALDTSTGTWSARASMPEARSNAAFVRIGDDVFVFGGQAPDETATALRYHIPTDSWHSIAAMPGPNSNMACAVVGGKAYLFGGGHGGAPRDVAWCYDPATDSWTTLAALPHARKSPVAVALGGEILVIGGHTAQSGVNDATAWVDVFVPAAGTWASAPDLPVALTAGAATARNGRAWLMGGIDGTPGYGKFAGVWSYAPGEVAWAVENPMPGALGGAVAVTTDATTLLVMGGSDELVEGVATVYWQFLNQPDIVLLRDVPNDQGGKVGIRWLASLLDQGPGSPVSGYQFWREVPLAAATRAIESGARLLAAGERPSAAGGRQIKAAPDGAEFIYWEYVGSQVAHGFPAYSYTAPTLFDSLPGANPRTRFMVEAEDPSTGDYWQSVPESGYSVDNLAPPSPGPVAFQFVQDGLKLSWLPSAAPDVAGYRVYRDVDPDFEPSPGTLVAAVGDTSYASSATGPCFFRVAGVDLHGNEGLATEPFANVLAVGDAPPAGLSLAAPTPNPAMGTTRIHYSLAREGEVRLAVYDVSGRERRVLVSGMQRAGEHAVVFDLADEWGARLGAGLYFVRLEAGGRSVPTRLAVIR